MVCSQCQGIERFFDGREAERRLRSYRKSGPGKSTRILVDAIKAYSADGKTLLDIGGGIGAVQHELMKAGVTEATCVEASTAYIDAASEEAARQGHGDRVTFHHGDFIDMAASLQPAHIVALDRVICCYHDVEGLVGLSSGLATEVYGLVYPRGNWALKAGFRLFNFILWLRRSPFRIFIHPDSVIDAAIRSNGLQRRFYRKTLLWQIVVYGH